MTAWTTVSACYLDPPFNSNANYNVLFKSPKGEKSHAQIEAFEDTWHWETGEAEEAIDQITRGTNSDTVALVEAMRSFLGENDMMAYLAMMAVRLLELHRVLKPTGSIYLHRDPTASHYLKLIIDAVFGVRLFRNEIVRKRTFSHWNASRRVGSAHDVLFFYSRAEKAVWNQPFVPYSEEYLKSKYRHSDPDGRIYRLVSLRNPSVRPNLQYEYKGYKPHEYKGYKPHPNGWAISRSRMETLESENRLQFPKSSDGRIELKQYLDEMDGTPIHDVWTDINPINSQAQERLGYPTQKPVALLERIISASSNEGDVILDPFCGCGTAVHMRPRSLNGNGWE